MSIVLDTHAWIWWVTEDGRLSDQARKAIETSLAEGSLWLSSISIWEVAKKVEKGQLILDRALDDWLDLALEPAGVKTVPLSRSVLVDSCRLPDALRGDPADQIIVATARTQGAVLVTRDAKLREYSHVRTLW